MQQSLAVYLLISLHYN